ncbi:MAG: hypothetical protein ABSF32_12650 [Ignavibacteria bacterium]|jgi:hypothetical protein
MPSHSPDLTWIEKDALIIGRAYPEPSKKHIETVCTGAITEEGELLRLYPIPLRYLHDDKKYKLWAWARFAVQKSPEDKRKESFRVREDSIKILSQSESKAEHFAMLKKAIAADLETLVKKYREDWTSLGIIEIDFVDLTPKLPRKNWEKEKGYMKQGHLLVDKKPLEQPPLHLALRFSCRNNPACKTHSSRLIAWEYMQAFRSFRDRYGSAPEAFGKIKDAIADKFSDPDTKTYALMGTHSRYPVWMVGQLYFVEKSVVETPTLF